MKLPKFLLYLLIFFSLSLISVPKVLAQPDDIYSDMCCDTATAAEDCKTLIVTNVSNAYCETSTLISGNKDCRDSGHQGACVRIRLNWEAYGAPSKFDEALKSCAVTGNMSLECYMHSGIVYSALGTLNAAIWGVKCQGSDCDKMTDYLSDGVIGITGKMMAFLYATPPVSAVNYLADLGKRFNWGVSPVYAQGKGWQALSPVLGLWKTARDVCYLFFVVIFVAIGMIIMFRKKVNPQTITSIQNALPKIVIALVLVTFSYALAGLMIDIIEITIALVSNILTANNFLTPGLAGTSSAVQDLIGRLTGNPPASPIGPVVAVPESEYANIMTIMSSLMATVSQIIDSIQTILKNVPFVGGALGLGIAGSMLKLVLGITLLQTFLKTFFMLITAFVNIIISTILSPFIFLFGSISADQGIGGWFKNMLGNVLVFPATFTLILLAAIIGKPVGAVAPGNDFVFPLTGLVNGNPVTPISYSPPPLGLFWQADPNGSSGFVVATNFMNYLIVFGILMLLPKVGEIVKGAFEGRGRPEIGAEIEGGLKGTLQKIPIVGQLL